MRNLNIEQRIEHLKSRAKIMHLPDHPQLLHFGSYYHRRYPGALPDIFARESVILGLLDVAAHLADDERLVIYDAYRSLQTQCHLWDLYKCHLQGEHPEDDEEEIIRKTNTFVFNPRVDPTAVPNHNSGGAVDLTILRGHRLLDMGTDFDDLTPVAYTAHFEGPPTADWAFSESRWRDVQANRRYLLTLMQEAGFTNYANEWWHYDMGTAFWQEVTGADFGYDSAEAEVNDLMKSK